MTNQTEWYKDWFASDYYQLVYKHRDNNDAKRFLELILSKIELTKDSIILDAACGAGRHLKYLQEVGYKNLNGFDLSLPLLKNAKDNKVKNVINSDIRTVFYKCKFDLILNIFTSFGYFEDDRDNFLFFNNAKEFLRPEGILVFDYFNTNYLVKNLVLESNSKIDDIAINEKRRIEKERVEKTIILKTNEMQINFKESVKLYSPEFLINRFQEIGYKVCGIYGSYNGADFDINLSDRIILFLENA